MDLLKSFIDPAPAPKSTLFSSTPSTPSRFSSSTTTSPLPPLLLTSSFIHLVSGTTYLLSPLLIPPNPDSIPVIQNLGLQNLSWGFTILLFARYTNGSSNKNKTTQSFIWWGLVSKDVIVCLGNAAFWGWRVFGERRRRWRWRAEQQSSEAEDEEEQEMAMPGMYLASARELEEGLPIEKKRALEVERAQKTLFGRLAVENVLTSTAFLSLVWFLVSSKTARASLKADLWTGVFRR